MTGFEGARSEISAASIAMKAAALRGTYALCAKFAHDKHFNRRRTHYA